MDIRCKSGDGKIAHPTMPLSSMHDGTAKIYSAQSEEVLVEDGVAVFIPGAVVLVGQEEVLD